MLKNKIRLDVEDVNVLTKSSYCRFYRQTVTQYLGLQNVFVWYFKIK